MMKLRILPLTIAILAPLTVLGQDLPLRPGDGEPIRNNRPWAGVGGRRRTNEQELIEVTQFMRENSPNRWRAVESLGEETPERRTVMTLVTARWRNLQTTREDDPALYDLKLKQLHIEDDIFGLLGATQTAAEREPMRAKVHDEVTELVNLQFQEREHRIQKLRSMLKVEEENLAKERKEQETMVDRRTNGLISEGSSAFRPATPRYPGRPAKPAPVENDKSPTTQPIK